MLRRTLSALSLLLLLLAPGLVAAQTAAPEIAGEWEMTDETPFPSAVTVRVNGELAGRYELDDDPADHRGILSWHHQRSTTRLEDAGSYGYMVRCELPADLVAEALRDGLLRLRLAVPAEAVVEDAGGLALYGARFGRYPLGPTLLFHPPG